MSPFLLLPLLTACSRPPALPDEPPAPRDFTLAYQAGLAGELEPCG